MEEIKQNNHVFLRGRVCDPPQYSHESREEEFYQLSLEVCRLSGTPDLVNVLVRGALMDDLELGGGSKLCVVGELRSFNNKSGIGPKLIITVFAKELWFDDGEDENTVELLGAICKAPNLRTTPLGREICDLMLAVNRRYGRSDYLPCIAWGIRARSAAEWPVGTAVRLSGRVQSRRYTKVIDGETVEKMAFEVSVIDLSPADT